MSVSSTVRVWLRLGAVLAFSSNVALAIDLNDTRLVADPSLSDSHVAFAYDGDLWIAGRDGSGVRRLTSDVGVERRPRFSPDGELLAFSGEYDGNVDVFVVSIHGGAPRRLTWHPGMDEVEGFSPDGRRVLFSSARQVFTNRYTQLFEVPVAGGFPERLPIPNGLRAAYSPDGGRIAYIPIRERFQQWKNYRGGTTSRIWIYDAADHGVVEIPQPEGRCNDTDPTWIGARVFFRSDRAGELNVFSYDTISREVTPVTDFEDFPVLTLTGNGRELVIEQAGYLHLVEPDGSSERLRLGVPADLVETRGRWVSGPQWIRRANLSPTGSRAVFDYRGDILTLPKENGDARNLTRSADAHERFPAWSPDGANIAYFSDASGEYELHIQPQNGQGETRVLPVEGHGFYFDLRFSPDGKRVSYTDNSQSLYWLDLESGASSLVATEPHYRPGLQGPEHNWSPDSRWITYSLHTPAYVRQVWVHDTTTDQSHPITDGYSEVSEPVFDESGKYLYFFGSTDAGPVKHWFAMSNADMRQTNSLYLAVLQKDVESPLAPESDEEPVAEDQAEETDGGGDGGESGEEPGEGAAEDVAVAIDLDGMSQRILAFPVDPGFLSDLDAGAEGKIFFRRRAANGRSTELVLYDLTEREETVLLADAAGYALSGDHKQLLYRSGEQWATAAAGSKIDRSKGILAVDRLRVRVDPPQEWRQIYHEAWRINRDYFYDPGMHGADWEAVGEKYSALLGDLATRGDLNRLLQWMSSELAVGHHRVFGGDDRDDPERIGGGLLGADYEIADGRYRFAKVFGGLNWDPELRAPLTEPGVQVSAGEYLLAVNGVGLDSSENLYSRFENTAGRVVEISVGEERDGSDARVVRVVPLENESALRNRDWVEGNLRKVDEATGGRVAYVYVPNTTTQGHAYFKRYFFPQVDKQAIIVDERFNGGGQVADYYIDHLRRPYISHWATRYGDDIATPSAAVFGPKVMIIDETAGSGGDLLPWMFRKLGLGTLVGKRTWGGLVGTLGFPALMDGGIITAPNLAIWTEDGFVVENVGVPPDIEVEQMPAEVIAGRDPQLEMAIRVALEQLEASPVPQPQKPPFPIRVRR